MRSRQEIEDDLQNEIDEKKNYLGTVSPQMAAGIVSVHMFELLLDIRELLANKPDHDA